MPKNKELTKIINLQTAVAQKGRDLAEIMELVVERTPDIVPADGAAIELAEDNDMVYRAVSGIAERNLGLRLHLESSLSGFSVISGQALRCDDSETDPRVHREACRKIGLRSMIIFPLRFEDHTIGVLKLMAKKPASFSRHDTELLSLLCDLVGAAMHHAVEHSEDNLFYMATHDQLTGLANRALFMDRLRKQASRCLREKTSLGVLIIDMDNLKEVNDNYGHRTGSNMIKEFSRRAKNSARDADTLARLGGDEFGMILNNVDSPAGISTAAGRIHSLMKEPFSFEGRRFRLQASIGGAIFPEDHQELEGLLEQADQRMYAAKREGKKSRLPGDA